MFVNKAFAMKKAQLSEFTTTGLTVQARQPLRCCLRQNLNPHLLGLQSGVSRTRQKPALGFTAAEICRA